MIATLYRQDSNSMKHFNPAPDAADVLNARVLADVNKNGEARRKFTQQLQENEMVQQVRPIKPLQRTTGEHKLAQRSRAEDNLSFCSPAASHITPKDCRAWH